MIITQSNAAMEPGLGYSKIHQRIVQNWLLILNNQKLNNKSEKYNENADTDPYFNPKNWNWIGRKKM